MHAAFFSVRAFHCYCRTALTTTQAGYAPRAATSFDGSAIWNTDGRALRYGALGATPVELTSVLYYFRTQGVVYGGVNTVLVSACGTSAVPCASGGLYYSSPSYAPTTATGQTFNRVGRWV